MTLFAASAVFIMAIFVLLGLWSGRKTRSGSDYSMAGRRSGTLGVSGILLGSLVGGASTVGTVQMAYQWGLSAWWFTLGGGLGCLVLGLWFAVPLRRSGMETIPGFLSLSYGKGSGYMSVIASSIGTFISIIAQFLAGAGLLLGIFPAHAHLSVLLVGILVLSFIFTGGLKSFSAIGVGKIAVLYLSLAICAAIALRSLFSYEGTLVPLPQKPFLDLFGQGIGNGLSAGASLITGVLCTQIYIQAVFSASTPATARKGALLSAILMPPLGLLGIIIGMSMRRTGASIQSSSALAHFIVSHFHPALGGLLWGGIMITVIGTAAGLTLGVATNMVSDLLHPFLPSEWGWKNSIWTVRVVILLLVLSAGSIGIAGHGSMILKWSYLSMGLRGSGIFFPMAAAIFSPGCLSPKFAIISGSAGIITTILWPVAALPGQPLFAGLAASAFFTLAGLYTGKGGSSPAGIH